ncbi:MAG: hypothetical protein IAE77_29395 [Prosthecobacter sp.]|uniref:hypothetical protein n=1 Tax=Prosthecobacter sp. TaxID=1965333 RepID=UPI0019F405CC|nr:hypothetical protein [Prosthecobacter sp.]MBE2287608.1 hypothetical protein [Prosthecobacter sp.]
MKADPSSAASPASDATPATQDQPGRSQIRRRTLTAEPEPAETTVPFDPGSCELPLVGEKEWADSYSKVRSRQRLPTPAFGTWMPLGQIEPMSGSGIGIAGLAEAFLTLIELAIMLWTGFLLLFGFPLPQVILLVAAGAWALVLLILGFIRRRRAAWRVFLWFGGGAVTLWWYLWSPRSGEMIRLLRSYSDFFLK